MRLAEIDGDRHERLVALRDRLAHSIDVCESMRDLASLSRQYREVVREIDEIEGGTETDDEIAAIILRHRKPGADGDGGA